MRRPECDFALENGVIRLDGETGTVFAWAKGPIINAAPSAKQKNALREWKVRVACAIKNARANSLWSSDHRYAVTLEFLFHPANHGNRPLDVDNFVKPVLDALAAGLFCEERQNPRDIREWNFPDSNFRTLLIHRHPDTETPGEERVHVFLSCCRGP